MRTMCTYLVIYSKSLIQTMWYLISISLMSSLQLKTQRLAPNDAIGFLGGLIKKIDFMKQLLYD